jgi:hypothetical protein
MKSVRWKTTLLYFLLFPSQAQRSCHVLCCTQLFNFSKINGSLFNGLFFTYRMKRPDPRVEIANNFVKQMTIYIYGEILINYSDVESVHFSSLTQFCTRKNNRVSNFLLF